MHILDTHGTLAIEQDAGGACAGENLQIGARQIGCDVGFGGAATLAVLLRHLVAAHTFLIGTVEIGVARVARLFARLHEQFAKAVGAAQIHHIEGAV